MYISEDVKYVGVNDKKTDLFEGQYIVPHGISYNSYIIKDEHAAVLDTVDVNFFDEWLENVKAALDGDKPDYLVVHHMEPDHSANIKRFVSEYPDVRIVASKKAFVMMEAFFGTDFPERQIVVADGDKLSLGRHTLTFFTAPMVHWPEVIVSYDDCDKLLFSADAFGKFGALDTDDEWACEARRYYIGIVGKYGAQAQSLLKKIATLDIRAICPLHGPVLKDNLCYYIDLYKKWSSYVPEEKGIVIAYTSVYGNTKAAVQKLAGLLRDGGAKVTVNDLARCDMAEAVEDAFRYDKLVLATTTYNAGIFPFMHEFIMHLTERNYQNRTVGFIENGSWAPMAVKVMRSMLAESKNITYIESSVRINSAMNEKNDAELRAMAEELLYK